MSLLFTSLLPGKPSPCTTQIQRSMPAHPALLALLCSAALVLGASPCVGASIVSLVSGPPPQPLPAWQCNAQDGSVTRGGVIVDASLPCNWKLTEAVATTHSEAPSTSAAEQSRASSAGRAGTDLWICVGRMLGLAGTG